MELRKCDNCTFWEPTEHSYGKCQMIKEKIEIELVTGWDGGYVKHIETEADFGCNQHQFLNE